MSRCKKIITGLALALTVTAGAAQAAVIDQYASSVNAFSSQWSSGSWSAAQTLGAPNTFGYGDISSSWAPGPINGTTEFLTLGFGTAVYATGVTVRETYGNGFVTSIWAGDALNSFVQVWSGIDTSLPGSPVDALFTWSPTNFLVTQLTIYVDTNHNLGAWEEIDSVQLHGTDERPVNGNSVPEPLSLSLLGAGLVGLGLARRRKSA